MVRRWFGRQEQSDDQIHDDLSFGDARRFSYRSLQRATNNFSDNRLIGEGGYARIYRGVLPTGTVIAVKNYKARESSAALPVHAMGQQLEDISVNPQEFIRMVEIISRIRHPNIHQGRGYCIHKSHVLLVSEYADNGSLHDLLHNQQNRFSWPMRVAVCIGIARGLTHLHEDVNPRAVHRDIKPSNILLDANFTPKITDFDLLKFFPTSDEVPLEAEAVDRTSGHSDSDPVLTTRVNGTMGYIAPEYLRIGRVTQKSDVYGFGGSNHA